MFVIIMAAAIAFTAATTGIMLDATMCEATALVILVMVGANLRRLAATLRTAA